MSGMRWAVAVLLGLLGGWTAMPAHATFIAPPAPLVIPFGPGDSRLEGAALEVVDRLIVRALHCAEGGTLRLTRHHLPGIDKALLARREQAIRGRIVALDLSIKVEREPTEEEDASQWLSGQDARQLKPPHWLLAGSASGKDDYCYEDRGLSGEPSSRLLPWLSQLERAMQRPPVQLPAFWGRLSTKVRQAYLSPALARLAHEQAQAGDVRAREVFWWLVDEEARRLPPSDRLHWVAYLWASGTDADLQDIQRRLSIGSIDLDERMQRAQDLMWSKLPWPVVERRLMAPGLMERVGMGLMHGQQRVGMTHVVVERNEWVSWGRLVRAAGTARACFLSDAVFLLQPHPRIGPPAALQHLPVWAAGPAGRVESGPYVCDPTAQLLAMGAGCNEPADNHPEVAAAWLKAGLVLHPETVTRALSPAGVWGEGKCQLEAAPTGPFPYRVRKH